MQRNPLYGKLPGAPRTWGLLLLIASGCSATATMTGQDRGRGSSWELPGAFVRTLSAVHPGQIDRVNHHLPAVRVQTASKAADGQSECSGVLISSRVVVTAGHCLCPKRSLTPAEVPKVTRVVDNALSSETRARRQSMLAEVLREATTIIDSSNCSGLSTVTLRTYSPTSPDAGTAGEAALIYSAAEHLGDMRPHDDLMVLYDRNSFTLFKHIDLGVIVLQVPVQGVSRFAKLPDAEVQEHEKAIMVGYGLTPEERARKAVGNRYFGESQVLRVAESGARNVQFFTGRQPPAGNPVTDVYGGDSGGPCFSKSDDPVLLGIANAYSQDEAGNRLSVFTSIYPHRRWLEKLVHDAEPGASQDGSITAPSGPTSSGSSRR